MRTYCLWLLLFAHQTCAQVYRHTAPNGTVTFSNIAMAGSDATLVHSQAPNRIDAFKRQTQPETTDQLLPEQEPAGNYPATIPPPHPSANPNIGAFERN
ncbi:hypothetical protein [Pseudomonas helleri]|uniref:hypothetical protein n=1 Tax=Pseudomonas helleri TaxID=1608996 RepID=UPI0037F91D4A